MREALAHPSLVVEVFAADRSSDVLVELRDAAAAGAVAWTEVGEDVIRAVADTVTPQWVVAVCRFLDRPLAEVLRAAPRLLAVGVDVSDRQPRQLTPELQQTADVVVTVGEAEVDPLPGPAYETWEIDERRGEAVAGALRAGDGFEIDIGHVTLVGLCRQCAAAARA